MVRNRQSRSSSTEPPDKITLLARIRQIRIVKCKKVVAYTPTACDAFNEVVSKGDIDFGLLQGLAGDIVESGRAYDALAEVWGICLSSAQWRSKKNKA